MLQFTPEICMEGNAWTQSISDNPSEGFEGPNPPVLMNNQPCSAPLLGQLPSTAQHTEMDNLCFPHSWQEFGVCSAGAATTQD